MPLQGVALSERGEAPAGRVSIGTMHLAKVVVTPFRGVGGSAGNRQLTSPMDG